jgi:release factor glutamine methyltransferase
MTLPQIKELFFERLQGLYPETEIESLFYLILEHHLGIKRIDLALRPELRTQVQDTDDFEKSLDQLARHRPIQYIMGQTEFAGMTFKVDESVLIPRPETEELVHWITETALHLTSPRILDIGTGSGCIPISLSKRIQGAEVHALDISPMALEIARDNARRLQAEVRFFQHDILGPEELDLSYDVLVSNPPYVRKSEKGMMRDNVLKHEPELALFVDDEDPLLFYRRISEHALRSVESGGYLFFEINEALADRTIALLADGPFTDIEVKKDIYGKDRMIRAVKK